MTFTSPVYTRIATRSVVILVKTATLASNGRAGASPTATRTSSGGRAAPAATVSILDASWSPREPGTLRTSTCLSSESTEYTVSPVGKVFTSGIDLRTGAEPELARNVTARGLESRLPWMTCARYGTSIRAPEGVVALVRIVTEPA